MEPGDLRESPAGSGESDAGDWREVIPGGEEDDKGAESIANALDATLRDTCDDFESDKQKGVGEALHSPYEEELDPRIQVCEPSSVHSGSASLVLLDLKDINQLSFLLPTTAFGGRVILKNKHVFR